MMFIKIQAFIMVKICYLQNIQIDHKYQHNGLSVKLLGMMSIFENSIFS